MVPRGETKELAEGVYVIPDQRVEFVPNIGIVVAGESALVIDTAIGPANGERVMEEVRGVAGDRRLFLTFTHSLSRARVRGADVQAGGHDPHNRAQPEDKGEEYIQMFSGFGPGLGGGVSPGARGLPRRSLRARSVAHPRLRCGLGNERAS
jgi:hypothetical protein